MEQRSARSSAALAKTRAALGRVSVLNVPALVTAALIATAELAHAHPGHEHGAGSNPFLHQYIDGNDLLLAAALGLVTVLLPTRRK